MLKHFTTLAKCSTRASSPYRFCATSTVFANRYSTTGESAKEEGENKQENNKSEGNELPALEIPEDATKEDLISLSNQLNKEKFEINNKYLKKDKDYAELKDHYLRSVADFRNLQETTKREIQKAKDYALQKFSKDLLESIDNFDHALRAVSKDSVEANNEIKDLYEGVKMVQTVFEKTLSRHGIVKIEPIGEKFNPNIHEATFEIPQPDKEPGTIFHVQQAGYSLNDRVLRAAKVGVVKSD